MKAQKGYLLKDISKEISTEAYWEITKRNTLPGNLHYYNQSSIKIYPHHCMAISYLSSLLLLHFLILQVIFRALQITEKVIRKDCDP